MYKRVCYIDGETVNINTLLDLASVVNATQLSTFWLLIKVKQRKISALMLLSCYCSRPTAREKFKPENTAYNTMGGQSCPTLPELWPYIQFDLYEYKAQTHSQVPTIPWSAFVRCALFQYHHHQANTELPC
jgi:hypothetical protein